MSRNQKAVILVGHGGLPRDCPREIIQQFKQLERERKGSGQPATAQEQELEKRIREWPRTPENDPIKPGSNNWRNVWNRYWRGHLWCWPTTNFARPR